jgi:hypothetical protein
LWLLLLLLLLFCILVGPVLLLRWVCLLVCF